VTETLIFADADTVAREAARAVAAAARAAVASRGRFVLALSGGRTPWQMLRALGDEAVPWSDVHVFQVDERIAPAGDPERNLTQLSESLLDRAALPPQQLYAMPRKPTSMPLGHATQARSSGLRVCRRSSISCISGSVRMATRHRWYRVIRCWKCPTGMSRSRASTGAAGA
jgi:6-phosphogluconolactonase/glucosamine-6-phosphate isomerase/deaminase